MSDDTRTMADLANEAIRVQDACNLSGVVHSFSRSISRLRVLLREQGRESTEDVNTHPICQLWADKIASLACMPSYRGSHTGHYAKAFSDVHDLAQPERTRRAEQLGSS